MDIRIVDVGQNQAPINAANVLKGLRGNGLKVALMNVSGDVYNASGGSAGSGGDGAINDGADSNIKASVKNTGGAKPLHVIITNVSGDTPNLPSSNPDGAIVDGANSALRATVKQYGSSNPQAVVLVNASGDAYNANSVSIAVNKWNLTPTQDAIHVNSGVLGVSGDVSTKPLAGQTWPVSISGTTPVSFAGQIGVQIIGGSVGAQVQPSGDFPVRIAGATAPIGVTGDVSTIPKAGQTWPVSQSGAWSFAGSGDINLVDGVTRSIKNTVRNYTNSKPIAVALVNSSGDDYAPVPSNPPLFTKTGRVNAAGSTQIVAAAGGKRIKVIEYSLQGDGNNSRGFFASAASGSQLTVEWEFATREGISKQVSSIGGGYIFATAAGSALSFESSSSQPMKYSVTYHSGDSI